ncbi:MAG: hypothetical protein ACF8SC_11560 [Phycisphaerales bacterium JB037]
MTNAKTQTQSEERSSLHPRDPDHPTHDEVIQQPPIVDPESPAVSDATYRTTSKAVWVGVLSYGLVLVIGALIALAIVSLL